MNELIEKLAEQAGMTIDKYGLARDAETGLEDGVDIYKFALSLIKECMFAVENHGGMCGATSSKKIKDHFGI